MRFEISELASVYESFEVILGKKAMCFNLFAESH